MFRILKKILIVISVIIVVLFLAFMVAAWHYGAFASVRAPNLAHRPSVYIATLDNTYAAYELDKQIRIIDSLLLQKNITNDGTMALFFDNPIHIRTDSIEAIGAILLATAVVLDSPLTLLKIPERKTAVTSIEAHPAIAPFKTYPALQRWLYNNGYQYDLELPIIEYYLPQTIVKVEIPVIADSAQDHLPLKEQ
jgi:hypothetical protein